MRAFRKHFYKSKSRPLIVCKQSDAEVRNNLHSSWLTDLLGCWKTHSVAQWESYHFAKPNAFSRLFLLVIELGQHGHWRSPTQEEQIQFSTTVSVIAIPSAMELSIRTKGNCGIVEIHPPPAVVLPDSRTHATVDTLFRTKSQTNSRSCGARCCDSPQRSSSIHR